jgi:hypothetical protein
MSLADPNHVEDQAVVQYLLGAAPQEQTELLDRLSVCDDDFARRLAAVEDDLVDAYVRGELPGDTLERFRSFYLSSPLRREKVRFAEALLPLADRPAPVAVVPARRFTISFPRLLAAAACLVLAAGLYWTFVSSRPAPRVQPNLAVAPQAPVSPAPTPLAGILFVLPPPTRRAATLPVLALPSDAASVTFRLELEANDSPAYRAVLKDLAANRIVWRSENRPAVVERGVPLVVLNVPAALLEHRAYSLNLAGIAASGAAETIGAYAFRVVAK